MARTMICGFEWRATDSRETSYDNNNFSNWASSGSVAVETGAGNFRSGTASLKATPASGVAGFFGPASGTLTGYHRFYIKVTSLPGSTRQIYGAAATAGNLRITSSGTIEYRSASTVVGTSSTALTDTTKWYRIEARFTTGTSVVCLRIDGVDEVTGNATTGATVAFGANDTVAATYTAYFDDFVIDNTGFPGDSSVVLLRPISDNNRGSWTGGSGGTTNLFDAVDNLPAGGVATASQSNTTNIESAANSASDNCDLNCTDYTTAGVTGTITAIMASCRHAEDISTNTKSGALTIVSNPAQSGEDSFTFGGDAGAANTDSGSASTWFTTVGTVQSSPSVTLGTSPVLRIGKRTATTRVVDCDAMGIYVEFVPSAATTVTGSDTSTGNPTETSTLVVPWASSDSLSVGLTEGVSIKAIFSANDDQAIHLDELTSLQDFIAMANLGEVAAVAVVIVGSDTLAGLLEGATAFILVSTGDTVSGLAESATPAATISTADTMGGLTDASTSKLFSSTSDTCSQLAEQTTGNNTCQASETFGGLAEDTRNLLLSAVGESITGLTENATPAATLSTSDTATVNPTEDVRLQVNNTAAELLTGLAEDSTSRLFLNPADTLPGLTEDQRSALLSSVNDTTTGNPTEDYRDFVSVATEESLVVGLAEASSVSVNDVGGATAVSSSDSLQVSLVEDATSLLLSQREDACSQLADSQTLFNACQASETLPGLTENADSKLLSSVDESVTGLTDAATININANAADTLGGLAEDTTSRLFLNPGELLTGLSEDNQNTLASATSDTLTVGLTETSTLEAGGITSISGSDTLPLGLAEDTTSALFSRAEETFAGFAETATGSATGQASDTLGNLTENVAVIVLVSTPDSLQVTVSDAFSSILVAATGTENVGGLAEDVTNALTASTEDTLPLTVQEAVSRILAVLTTDEQVAIQLTEAADAVDAASIIHAKTGSDILTHLTDHAVVHTYLADDTVRIITTVDFTGEYTAIFD